MGRKASLIRGKIQIQIVMHDGSSTTFHFVNPNGSQTQIKDRDEVKELLQQLLPKFKRKVNKELEEKNRMLRENPGLLQLYKDLVSVLVVVCRLNALLMKFKIELMTNISMSDWKEEAKISKRFRV